MKNISRQLNLQNYLLVFFAMLQLSIITISCNNKSDPKLKGGPVQDTTALGIKIGEVSAKIGKNPNDAALFHERAKLHMQRLDVANAMLDMQKVIELDTTKADYFLTLADVHFAANKTAKSRASLEKCLELDPKNILALEKLAELYFYVQDYPKSISYLDQILKIDIHNSKAYLMKGMNYKEKGDTIKAISSFQTSIEQKTDNYDAYQQLGMIYTAQNNPLALQYFDGALRLNPKSQEALYGRGMFYQEVKKDYDKAIQDYTSITQLNSKNAAAYFALGFIHYQYLKVYGEGAKYYTKAIESDPTWPEAVYNRGLCYEAVGDINAARIDYNKAITLRPDYVLAQKGLDRVK